MLETINSGDTAWILISTALVFLMVPGFVFFYGGLFPRKNLLTILILCFMMVCLVSLQWVLFGYSLAFGPDHNGWIGTLAWAGLRGVGGEPNLEYAGTIPHQAFMIYHLIAAVIAPVILLSAFAERIKLGSLCVFTLLWTALVYDPIAHWVWGVGGFLRYAGVLDWAGGTVVHLNAGISALAMILVLGKSPEPSPSGSLSSNIPFAALGAGLLWFGWFGLNAGNALSAGALAGSVLVVTQISPAAAGLTWSLLDRLVHQKLTPLGIMTGAVAGLVAISPAAGFVSVWGAMGIGVGAGIVSYAALALLEKKFGYDDSFYTLAVFGAEGIWGMMATGLWASKNINSSGADGLFQGSPGQLLIQLKATLATTIYAFGMSYLILKIIDYVIGLRVSEQSSQN